MSEFWQKNMVLDSIYIDNLHIEEEVIKIDNKNFGKRFYFNEESIRSLLMKMLRTSGKLENCESPVHSGGIKNRPKNQSFGGGFDIILKWDKSKQKHKKHGKVLVYEEMDEWDRVLVGIPEFGTQMCKFISFDPETYTVELECSDTTYTNAHGQPNYFYGEGRKYYISIEHILKINRKCPICKGSGRVFALREFFTCGPCKGTGRVEHDIEKDFFMDIKKIEKVAEILAKYDPPGLIDKDVGNFDEYNHEARMILEELPKCEGEEGLYELVLNIFKKSVEYIGDSKEYKPIVKEIWELCH